jgi:hypothetical protein
MPVWFTPVLFAALALLFAGLAGRDHVRNQGRPTTARRTFVRLAAIFAVVSLGLLLLATR